MAKRKCFLAIDVGASSGRVLLGRFNGQRLDIRECHRFANGPVVAAGTMYWDVLRLFEDLKEGLARGAALAGGPVDGIGVDTWGVDFGLLDKQGRLLGNPVHYRDSRTDGIFAKAFRRLAKREIFELSGIQFLQFNTAFQLLAMSMAKSPLLYCAHRLLMMPDLFNYFLTGVANTEFTIASTTQLYDPRRNRWADEIFERFGIPRGIMGRVRQPGRVLGPVNRDAAGQTGTGKAPIIAVAGHDTGSAVAAVPAGKGSWAYLSSGTWSLMGGELTRPLIGPEALRYNFTNEGGVEHTFRFLKNIAGLWLIQECRRIWQQQEGKSISFAEIDRLARSAGALRSFVDQDDHSFLRPLNMPRAIADFCKRTGQKVPADRGAIVRCALESLALKYRMVLRNMESLLQRRVEVLHVVGGGAQNDLLNQWTANALGITVIAGPVEATATGNLMVQALATGLVSSLAEIREVVRGSFPLKTYEPRDEAIWDDAYGRFEKICKKK